MEQIPKNRLIGTFFICFLLLPFLLHAQSTPFSSFKKYPFPPGLCAGYLCNKIAWAVDEQGVRNIYIAEAPNFQARKLTNYTKNDGQEITRVTFSNGDKYHVFARGGENGSNWESDWHLN